MMNDILVTLFLIIFIVMILGAAPIWSKDHANIVRKFLGFGPHK